MITLSEYKAQRLMRRGPARTGTSQGLPDADQLRELLDRNISLKVWKKGI